MPVPTAISELSTTPGSNSPVGADAPSVLDDHIRTVYAFIKTLSDEKLAGADGSVTTAKIADLAVTAAKINDLAVTSGKIAADSVTFAKLQNIATSRILGRSTASSGDVEELTLGSNLTLAAGVLNALDGVPAGAVSAFARSTAPSGWLKANGALVSRTTYATLFAAIGTTFGVGDGSTTFALPDLRGEFIRGWDDSRGVDSGRVFGSAQSGAIESHSHNILTGANIAGGPYLAISSAAFASLNTGSTGGGETRPRNVALLACIKF